jgi:hypothetical protein
LSSRENFGARQSLSTSPCSSFEILRLNRPLRNAQPVTIAYDGLNPKPPMFCYLKPYYNDPQQIVFRASGRRRTLMNGFGFGRQAGKANFGCGGLQRIRIC